MTARLTVRLPEDLIRSLDAAAERLRSNRSEVVRVALGRYLRLQPTKNQPTADGARDLPGSLECDISDLAENNRTYLIEAIRHRA